MLPTFADGAYVYLCSLSHSYVTRQYSSVSRLFAKLPLNGPSSPLLRTVDQRDLHGNFPAGGVNWTPPKTMNLSTFFLYFLGGRQYVAFT